ncbi:hypothetical protein HK104_010305 [Borealophlyctis nickersoniae]|nr:hypothetical protein HK104_010305 [Borealophlyctis nickersoniae]
MKRNLRLQHFLVAENYTKEKTRLQNLMATNGKSADVDTLADESRRADDGHSGAEPEEDLDEFDMVMGEIQERRQWLDDMIALGHGDKYKDAIRAEIASRISKLEQIDRERTRDEEAARFAVPSNNGVGRRGARGVSETNIGGLATAAEEY